MSKEINLDRFSGSGADFPHRNSYKKGQIMNEQYYIKQGRRYVPVMPFTGFPSDGIFLVQNDGHNYRLILKLSGLPMESEVLTNYAKEYAYLNDKVLFALQQIAQQKKGSVNLIEMAAAVTSEILTVIPGVIAKGY